MVELELKTWIREFQSWCGSRQAARLAAAAAAAAASS